MSSSLRYLCLGIVGIASLVTTGPARAESDLMSEGKDIVTNTAHSMHHKKLSAAMDAAGLAGIMQGKGSFTIFAPTDDAFAELPADAVDNLMKPESKEKLTKFLNCHMLAGNFTTLDMMKMVRADRGTHEVTTVGGCKLQLSVKAAKIVIQDENGSTATVTAANQKQSNGEVQTVDHVLQPKN